MATIFDDWKQALNDFQSKVSNDLIEIRQQKAEIQQLKTEIFNKVAQGRFIRDDQRLVLSAPEIVIGNVDASGMLYSEKGAIVIRGQRVGVEGVGENGIIENRAPKISQMAVDPGPDGVDAVVRSCSSIVSQAKQITIQSNQAAENGYFSRSPKADGVSVCIHSDKTVDIDASVSVETRAMDIDAQLKNLNSAVTGQTLDAGEAVTAVGTLATQMNALLELQDPLTVNELTMRTTVTELDDLTEQFYNLLPTIYNAMETAVGRLSRLAETKRRIKALTDEKTELDKTKADFDTKSTDAVLHVNAEQMFFKSADGDGKIRTNKEASISVQTGKVDITTMKPDDNSPIEDSYVSINSQHINIATGYDLIKDGKTKAVADGAVTVWSKDISFTSQDEDEGNFVQAKDSRFNIMMENMSFSSQDKDGNSAGQFRVFANEQAYESFDKDGNSTGSVTVRAKDTKIQSLDMDANTIGSLTVKTENTTFASTDKSGNAIGQFSLNSKDVFVKSIDTDDKGADKCLASGGNMVLVAEKMFLGRTDKDNTSKELQLSSDKTGIYVTTTAEIQQGDAKAVVQLDGGNVAVSGSKTALYGTHTVNGNVDFTQNITVKMVTADNVDVKQQLKSKNFTDGVCIPAPPSNAKLSAKLKEADAPKAKTNEGGNQE